MQSHKCHITSYQGPTLVYTNRLCEKNGFNGALEINLQFVYPLTALNGGSFILELFQNLLLYTIVASSKKR